MRQTKIPLRVTRFGEPVAEIVSPSPDPGQKSWIGSMKDTMAIVVDVVPPVIDEKASRLKLLFDTHIWLSALHDPSRLSHASEMC